MICKKCGANVPDGMNFCTTCGVRLNEEVQENLPENNAGVVPAANENVPEALSEEPKNSKKKNFSHVLIGFAIGLCVCMVVVAVAFVSEYNKFAELKETEAKLVRLWINEDEESRITKFKIERYGDAAYMSYHGGYYYNFTYYDRARPNDNDNWHYESYNFTSEKNFITIGNRYYTVEFNEEGNEVTLTYDEVKNRDIYNQEYYYGGDYESKDFSGKWYTDETVEYEYTFNDFIGDLKILYR